VENLLDTVRLHLLVAWRRRWYALTLAWLVCVFGWIALARIPDQYEANVRLHVDTDALLGPLLRGLTVDTGTASQADLMQKTLLTRTNLAKLLKMSYPTVAEGPEAERERLSQRLALAIQITSTGPNLVTVAYRDSSPKTAYDVVKAAATIFVDNQADAARSDMDNAKRFLKEQIANYESQLSDAEKRRADFRARYYDILPGEGNAPSRLQLAKDTLAKLEGDHADAELRLNATKEQLKSIPQFLSVDGGVNIMNGGVVTTLSPAQQQLFEAERNLKALQLRDTDRHPDVIAAKRLVALLHSEAGGTGPEPTGHTISNPVYEQVRLQIVDKETDLASLEAKIAEARAAADRLDQLARDAPGVDAEYARLDRDYTIIQRNYNELVARLEQARIADAANESTDNKIQVVDPPQLPQVPVAPKRPLLISAVLIAGIGAGIALIVLFGQLDRSFNALNSLRRRVDVPVLGAISYVSNGTYRKIWLRSAGFALAAAILFGVYGELMMRAIGGKVGV
jgi:polysaccharide chain length determinant protein (PEP-CTERM system associated)